MSAYIRCVDGCRHIRVLSAGYRACYRYPGRPDGKAVASDLAEQVYPFVDDDTIACGEFQRPDWRVESAIREQEVNAHAA